MKKVLITIVALFLFVGISQAQNKMWLNIGGNVLLPMGDFGDAVGTGFGGTAQFEMQFMPQLLGTATIGYLMWGGKDITAFTGSNYSGPDYTGIPILVGAKYYFMPGSGFYGHAQLGLMLFSADDVTINGYTFDAGSSTEFTLGLGAGYELPLSPKLMLDLSGGFLLISDANNIGLRAGLKWGL